MINPVNSNPASTSSYSTKDKTPVRNAATEKADPSVIVEINKGDVKSATYSKPAQVKPNVEELQRLWEETEKAVQPLKELVQKLITGQGIVMKDLIDGKVQLKIDAGTQAEAQQLISEDGELGVMKTATRIVEFAKAISGGDKSKLSTLRDAIKKGFGEAEKDLGKLPEISRKTYDEVMKQLDAWEKEE